MTLLTTAVAQDLVEITAGADNPCIIHEVFLNQGGFAGDANADLMAIEYGRATASGSSGTTQTSRAHDPGDAASSATVETGNTTAATGFTTMGIEVFNVMFGYRHRPGPDDRIVLGGSDIFVFRILSLTPPASTYAIAGYITYEELG